MQNRRVPGMNNQFIHVNMFQPLVSHIESRIDNNCQSVVQNTALLPIIAGYQLSPPENKMFILQLWLYILKAFSCVFVPFTLEIVLPYLLDLGCYFGEVISI